MVRAVDHGGFYQIPSDNRDLNYTKYFVQGDTNASTANDYNSHNTKRLSFEETIELISNLDIVKYELERKKGDII